MPLDGDIFDALATSANWERLRERTSANASPEYIALKHDFVNVLMIIAADIQRIQRHARATAVEFEAHESAVRALDGKIFDSEEGALPRQERRIKDYVDSKVGKLNAVALTILGGTITGLAVLFISGGAR